MKPKQIMLIAGEPSGDLWAAELVRALRSELAAADTQYSADSQPLHTGLEPRFFGAGGPRMAAAGVELAFDLTEHSVVGLPTPKEYIESRQRFNQLLRLAIERQPDVIVGVDYNYFNLHFTEAVRKYTSHLSGWFQDWRPKFVKYISPQLWASREGRVFQMERDYDLILSIFPFEKAWYVARVPKLWVDYVGHPLLDIVGTPVVKNHIDNSKPFIVLLPGSRKGELRRHLPVMSNAMKKIREKLPDVKAKIVLPNEKFLALAKSLGADCEIQIGNLPQALAQADAAIASTGTVTVECAVFGVPTVTLYKKALLGVALRTGIIKSKWFAMPNIMAREEVFPEFIQNAATSENIANAALDLLLNESRRKSIKEKLVPIVASLGGPGASRRAAQAITRLLEPGMNANGQDNQRKLLSLTH